MIAVKVGIADASEAVLEELSVYWMWARGEEGDARFRRKEKGEGHG